MKLLALTLLAVVLGSSSAEEACYPPLGCFTDDPPYVPWLPWSPEKIGTEFWLYTRSTRSYEYLDYSNTNSISSSSFDKNHPTKFLIHGFISDGDTDWVQSLRETLLNAGDFNVIVVHWEEGANPALMDYGQAVANTRVVGAQIAQMILELNSVAKTTNANMHVIGHSLGAHIAGYAGERLDGMGRISGLDPAGPLFEDTDPKVRLDPTDAIFVDAIHTDAETIWELGAGIEMPVGHADFYPNGGTNQPGCPGHDYDPGAWWKFTCNHGRACELYEDSIVNADSPMTGRPCDNYDDYQNSQCTSCTLVGCADLGYYSDEGGHKDRTVTYYLTTNSVAPYADGEKS